MRLTGLLTNTPPGGPATNSLTWNYAIAAVEDRIRTGKDTGLRNLPFYDIAHNQIWVAIVAPHPGGPRPCAPTPTSPPPSVPAVPPRPAFFGLMYFSALRPEEVANVRSHNLALPAEG
jgi:hypothetical protein